jgi:uncharacterized Tic20 family protein
MSNPYASSRPWTPEEEKTASILIHAISIVLELIAPIIGYVVFKEKGPYVNHHSKESLNFSLTLLLFYVILAVSVVGWVVIWAVPIYSTIFRIIAAVKASQGDFYKYPMTIHFIK